MAFSFTPSTSWLPWLFLVSRTFAQCSGETSVYSSDGLTVPFKNLCGKDITAVVDFMDPTNELTWEDCMGRCVEKQPLCYGFDFTPYGQTNHSCWLMSSTFPESSAQPQSYTVDAAMLTPEYLASLRDDCQSLGLRGCYLSNNRAGVTDDTVTVTSVPPTATPLSVASSVIAAETPNTISTLSSIISSTSTSTSTPGGSPPPGQIGTEGGLSTGAKAGIGVGVAVVALLLLLGGLFFLKRRKARATDAGQAPYPYSTEKTVYTDPHGRGLAELQGPNGPYRTAELPSPTKYDAGARQTGVFEIDGTPRYERP
ncbi:hypothetical protein IQ07DRAFT_632099 [Pyrenochaeta sp. DS3sAY3a]|nr:hypothetical protein IQ07DRAFT_632099 [Pyrenochaeta sp. DS3sAY3a]